MIGLTHSICAAPVAPQIIVSPSWNTQPRVGQALNVSSGYPALTSNTFEIFDGNPAAAGVSVFGPATHAAVQSYIVQAASEGATMYVQWSVASSAGSAVASVAAPGVVLPALAAPSATLNTDLTGRTVTAWLTGMSAVLIAIPTLDVFTAAGSDVTGGVTGAGTEGDPWRYSVPSSGSITDIVIGASLDNGVAPAWSDTDSTLSIPGDQTAPIVTVAMAQPNFGDGETVDAADIVPTISAVGNPALQPADLTTILMVDGTSVSLPHTALEGEVLVPRVMASHPSGAIDITGNGVTVLPGFSLTESPIDAELEINGASGTVTITVTSPAIYADYDAGNGAGVFTFASADFASGPINLARPLVITDGSPAENETLTLTPGLWVYDPDNGGLGSASYQWQRDGVDITGATSTSYSLTPSDAGADIRVTETLSDNDGLRTATSATVSVAGGDTDPGTVDPEAGLTVSQTFAPSTNINGNDIASADRDLSVVFAVDFTGLDGSAGGAILEHGGQGLGTYVAFKTDGTFVIRGGAGDAGAFPAGCAYIEMTTGQPSGDGTLVWEFDVTSGTVRAWWNDVEIGTPTGSFSGDWTGSDGGSYLNFELGASETGAVGLTGPVAYTTASSLRIYHNTASNA